MKTAITNTQCSIAFKSIVSDSHMNIDIYNNRDINKFRINNYIRNSKNLSMIVFFAILILNSSVIKTTRISKAQVNLKHNKNDLADNTDNLNTKEEINTDDMTEEELQLKLKEIEALEKKANKENNITNDSKTNTINNELDDYSEHNQESSNTPNHLNLSFISNLELRYLLDIIKHSGIFRKLFTKAKNIIARETRNEIDYKQIGNSDFAFTSNKPTFFNDENNELGLKGAVDLIIIKNKNNRNSKNTDIDIYYKEKNLKNDNREKTRKNIKKLEVINIWLISNSNIIVGYNNVESRDIIFQIKNSQLSFKEIYSTPCFLLSNIKTQYEARSSYLICCSTIEERNMWSGIIKNKANYNILE